MRASQATYVAQKWLRTGEILLSGNPKRIVNRAKNIIIGKALARLGVWKFLWGKWF